MKRISKLLRSPYYKAEYTSLLHSLRAAPKKKVEEIQVSSDDVINIFKERPEPDLENKNYPVWLFELVIPRHNPHSLIHAWRSGEKAMFPSPNASEVTSLLKTIKKLKIKEMNRFNRKKDQDLDDYRKEHAERDLFGKKEDELRSKAMADEAAEDEEEDEDEEEEEDGKRKRPVQQKDEDDEKDAGPPPGSDKTAKGSAPKGAPAKGGKKK